jgi:LacI family transcriptional regulator
VSVTLVEVARAAGVHPATASRALNPATQARVAAGTVRRVRAAADRLGYQPNQVARGLRTRRSYTVGVLLPDLTNPLFPPIVRGADEVLGPAGYSPLIVNTDNDAVREERLVAALRARQADGFIVATARRAHPLLSQLSSQVPMVLVNRHTDDPEIPSVVPDEASGIRLAVAHLRALGHERIAHLAGPQDLSTGRSRLRAFTDAAGNSSPVAFAETFAEAAGAAAARALLRHRPTAVIAANDLLALGILDVLDEEGLSCPHDVSVVGFNDIPMMARLGLTTVRIPHRDLGAEAARVLLARLQDPALRPGRLLLPCDLVVRDSTAPPARR